jgi:hypothetical protein
MTCRSKSWMSVFGCMAPPFLSDMGITEEHTMVILSPPSNPEVKPDAHSLPPLPFVVCNLLVGHSYR